ncbi:MAG: BatA domain-containing protein [Phycisphaeraceae bacterium]
MTFLAPWFLLGLLAAVIPLALHLRRARRAQTITFSTNQFFDERFLRASRRAKLQDLLLMLMRMALLALLALALAQPLIRTSGLGMLGGGGEARHVAIVIDDSAGMGVQTRDGLLLERARDAALQLLDELSPARGDRATVVLAGRREAGAAVLFDEPTPELAQVREAIRQIELTDLASDVDSAVAAAARAMGVGEGEAASSGQREVYVFSDLQDGALRVDESLAVGPGVGVMLVATRPEPGEAAANVAVEAVQYGAARPMVGVPFHFRAMLTNHGPDPQTVTADLVIGDNTVSQRDVELPAGRSRLVRFTHRFTDAGWFAGRIAISRAEGGSSDALAADDARHFAVQVEDRVRVLAVNGARSQVRRNDELFFLRLALSVQPDQLPGEAMQGQPPVHVDETTPAELTADRLAGHPLLVLANVAELSDDTIEAVEQYVDRGGSVLITLGDRVRRDAYNRWSVEHRLHGGLLPARLGDLLGDDDDAATARLAALDVNADADQDPHIIATIDEAHPMLAGFGAGGMGSFSNVRFTRRYQLAPRDGADVLMRDATGQPVLVERRYGRGRVMLFASSIDRDWTSFPLDPTYVPWVYRAVGYLAQQAAPGANFIRTGQVVSLPTAASEAEPMRIEGPGGVVGYPEPDMQTGGGLAYRETEQAGVYAIRPSAAAVGSAPARLVAANVPSDVSQRWYLDEAALRDRLHPQTAMAFLDRPEALVSEGGVARQGRGLWNTLLWLALLVALFEPWLANRLSRRRAAQVRDALDKRDQLPGGLRVSEAEAAREREAETVGAA